LALNVVARELADTNNGCAVASVAVLTARGVMDAINYGFR